jgi:glycosyltransferase involved in cell wall biosynthesis
MLNAFSIVDYIVLGALLGVFLVQIYWLSRYLAAPARRLRKSKKTPAANEPSPVSEGVSVILCAHNESDNLSNYLQALLTQDYPTYEVIVVDDGSQDATRAVIDNYMIHDPRLRFTFVPVDAHVGSTKKLALTLAAKAARYDYLLLTDADCVPESSHWISEMMAGFRQPIDIVLGYGAYFVEKGHINRLVRYDTLFNGLHYLGAALCGHPYMGVGRNLAYRKRLFFESGGFSHLMNNRAGDDDLFVNSVATPTNTAVALNPDSYTWSHTKRSFKEWWLQKRRHVSVSPAYKSATKVRLTIEPVTRGLLYALTLAVIIGYGMPLLDLAINGWTSFNPDMDNMLRIIIVGSAAGLFLVRWILLTAILNVSARRMDQKRFNMGSILWFDIMLPLTNLWMLAIPRKQTKW